MRKAGMDMWIPVAYELPKNRQRIIISTTDGKVGEASFQEGIPEIDCAPIFLMPHEYDEQYTQEQVTAWMPLPEPYEPLQN